jgi:hypothetical protein
MSCCKNKPDGCRQGRECEVHNQIGEHRLERIQQWILENYLVVSNVWMMIILMVIFGVIWVFNQ